MNRLHVIIKGEVHGVFFRDYTQKIAIQLKLKGWVKNIPEGVETVAEGDEESLEKFLEKLNQGPLAAKVTKVEHKIEKATGEFRDFEIRH